MSEHLSIQRINDLVDGLLSADEADRARAHVDGCALCREDVAVLSETVASLRTLPRSAAPPEHLWEGVAARIDGARPTGSLSEDDPEGATVVAFPTRPDATRWDSGPSERGRRDRASFSLTQLAVAAGVAALLSAGTVWTALRPAGVVTTPPVVAGLDGGPVLGAAARAASTRGTGYDQTILELEGLVAAGRGVLSPQTLESLESSLAAIDDALSDVRQALEEDPASELLMGMLVNHQTAKLRVLRQAANRIQARS